MAHRNRIYNLTSEQLKQLTTRLCMTNTKAAWTATTWWLQQQFCFDFEDAGGISREMIGALLSDSDPTTLPVRLDMILDTWMPEDFD